MVAWEQIVAKQRLGLMQVYNGRATLLRKPIETQGTSRTPNRSARTRSKTASSPLSTYSSLNNPELEERFLSTNGILSNGCQRRIQASFIVAIDKA